jgi:hypothetical protein
MFVKNFKQFTDNFPRSIKNGKFIPSKRDEQSIIMSGTVIANAKGWTIEDIQDVKVEQGV